MQILKTRDKLTLAVGAYYGEGPPVPIPNTEVKLTSANDTWLATARENRSVPTLNDCFSICWGSLFIERKEHLFFNTGGGKTSLLRRSER